MRYFLQEMRRCVVQQGREERSYWSSEEFGTERDKTVGGYSALVMRMYNCKTYFKSKDSYYYVRAVAQFY